MAKRMFLAVGLCFAVSIVKAETVSFFNVSFKSVNYSIDSSSAKLHFKDVYVKENLKDVEVNVGAVSIELRLELKKGEFVYTTLDIFNASVDSLDDIWLKPEKVVIVVRYKRDEKIWKDFLAKVKKKQEAKRKETADPVRVIPPNVED